ncbi:DUF4260 domain-containing protein [Fodinibius saliphilus]|uniref:DUF4260 domain-containing protein n=1 Tax=Fodinibius saliphilus TaxID=1920650 RepID=UPI0011083B7F|nr:DUF4260 domain-containing protein [Fodinibius saliphilus]
MKNLLKLEELGMFLLSVFLFAETEIVWWLFPVLILLPVIGMVGYVLNDRYGAFCYNLFHHKGLAILFFAAGLFFKIPVFELIGIIIFGHASVDRIFGYGLKYISSFQDTHLGKIGKN